MDENGIARIVVLDVGASTCLATAVEVSFVDEKADLRVARYLEMPPTAAGFWTDKFLFDVLQQQLSHREFTSYKTNTLPVL
jgi:hypothetical protein